MEKIKQRIAELKNIIIGLGIEVAELDENVKELEKHPFNRGDTYFAVTSTGDIAMLTWDCDDHDKKTFNYGNAFATREEAEFDLERRKVEAELKRFADKHNKELDYSNPYNPIYYLVCDYVKNKVDIVSPISHWLKYSGVQFSSGGLAKQAIKEVGEDRIKKYYLGVEE